MAEHEPLSQDTAQNAAQDIIERISRILSFYPVGSLKKAEPAPGGVMNENWFVETDTGKYFLRCRSLFFTPNSIDFELKLIEYLSNLGFPTPRLINTLEGALKVQAENRYWELYEYLPGEPFSVNNLAQTKSAAKMLARFHIATAGYQGRANGVPYRRFDLGSVAGVIDQLKEMVSYELKTSTLGTMLEPGIIGFIEGQEEAVINGIQPLSGSLLTVIHGDYQPSNVIFKGNEAIAVIDFGNSALSYRSYDVARAILGFSALRPDYKSQRDLNPWLDMNRVKAFFRAYQAEMPISEAGIQAMPALIRGTYLFGISFYMRIEEDIKKKAAFLINALSFIRWLDSTEAELKEILLQEAQSIRAQGDGSRD